MSVLTIPAKSLSLTKDKAVTFLNPEKMKEIKYSLIKRTELHKGKHFKVSLSVTLFDKVTKDVLTFFEDSPVPNATICLTRDIFHHVVDGEHLLEVLAHNAIAEIKHKFQIQLDNIEDLVREKINSFNFGFFVDKNRLDKTPPVVTVSLILGVCSDTLSQAKTFNKDKHFWLNKNAVLIIKDRIVLDDTSLVVMKVMNDMG